MTHLKSEEVVEAAISHRMRTLFFLEGRDEWI